MKCFGNLASYGVVLNAAEDPTVENLYATDMYKDYCIQAFHWTQDGIQPGDPTDTNTAQDYFNAQNLFCCVADINPSQLAATWGPRAQNAGFEIGSAMLVDPVITNSRHRVHVGYCYKLRASGQGYGLPKLPLL